MGRSASRPASWAKLAVPVAAYVMAMAVRKSIEENSEMIT